MSNSDIDRHRDAFLAAVRGISTNHVIAVMNRATPGVEWRHCSKTLMAEDYGKAMVTGRFTMSIQADKGMCRLNLEALRRAALERQSGRDWIEHYQPLPEEA